jgi:hypothetical protein
VFALAWANIVRQSRVTKQEVRKARAGVWATPIWAGKSCATPQESSRAPAQLPTRLEVMFRLPRELHPDMTGVGARRGREPPSVSSEADEPENPGESEQAHAIQTYMTYMVRWGCVSDEPCSSRCSPAQVIQPAAVSRSLAGSARTGKPNAHARLR